MKKGMVSIVLPCYNSGEFIGRCLQALLRQKYSNIQLIIINDGSTDNTESIIKSQYIHKLEQKGISVLYHYHSNMGLSKTFNVALGFVEGEFLTWIDPDDFLNENAILKKVEYLNNNKDYGFVRNNAKFVDENNLDKCVGKIESSKNEMIFDDLLFERKMPLTAGNYLLRTDIFFNSIKSQKIVEGYRSQNWPALLPIAYRNKCGYIDEILNTIVVRSGSMSNDISYDDTKTRIQEHNNILIDVLDTISGDLNKYKRLVNIKYASLKLIHAIRNDDDDVIDYIINGKYEVSLKARFYYWLNRYFGINYGA